MTRNRQNSRPGETYPYVAMFNVLGKLEKHLTNYHALHSVIPPGVVAAKAGAAYADIHVFCAEMFYFNNF